MARDDLIQMEGVVTDLAAGGHYTIELPGGQSVNAKLSGRLRKFHIRVIVGDRVTVGLSPYDPTHGIIIHRQNLKPKNAPVN